MGSLSGVQHEVIVGTLLGDGSMRCKTNALLEINHSVHQRAYVDWKYSHLASLVATPQVELTPLTMAVWFMDDGSRSRNAVYLNTQQFDEETQRRLLSELREQWGIEGSLNRDKSYHRIRLTVVGTVRFVELVSPHMLPGFWYKLPRVTP